MIKRYCDWCEEEIETSQSKISFLEEKGIFGISKEIICYKCFHKMNRLKKDIKKDVKRGKNE